MVSATARADLAHRAASLLRARRYSAPESARCANASIEAFGSGFSRLRAEWSSATATLGRLRCACAWPTRAWRAAMSCASPHRSTARFAPSRACWLSASARWLVSSVKRDSDARATCSYSPAASPSINTRPRIVSASSTLPDAPSNSPRTRRRRSEAPHPRARHRYKRGSHWPTRPPRTVVVRPLLRPRGQMAQERPREADAHRRARLLHGALAAGALAA